MDGGLVARLPDAQWSTAGAPAREQLDLWREAVNRAFVPVEVSRVAPGQFVSEVAVHRLGPVELSQIAAPAQTVRRDLGHVTSSRSDVIFLNLPRSGGAVVEQAGRRTELAVGDFALIDGDRPFDLSFDRDFRQVSLKLPREVLLGSGVLASTDFAGARVDGGSGVGAVASASIRAAADAAATLDTRTSMLLADRLVDLVVLALGGAAIGTELSTRLPTTLLLQSAMDQARRRFGDPGLTPASVAESVGISVRYLHRLFTETGQSFSRWLLWQRLELARRDLSDAHLGRLTIAEIARRHGFDDPSYFSRAFRARYNLRPTQLRPPAAARAPESP